METDDLAECEISTRLESMPLEASNDGDIQLCTVETVQSQNWSHHQPQTICGFIWSAEDDEMSSGSKPIGIQFANSSSGGRDCKFLVDAKLRSSDVIWEVMPFEMKRESERLQLFKRSAVAVKRKYVDLFPKTTTLQTDILNVRRTPTDTTHDLTITIKRRTYREATIEWTSDVPHVDRWLIIIRNEGRTPRQSTDPVRDSEWMILLTPSDDKSLNKIDQSLVSLEYEAGHRYTVAVYGLREEKIFDEIGRYINVVNSTTSFRAEHTKEDLEKLLVIARGLREHTKTDQFRQPFKFPYARNDLNSCRWLYRDKPKEYFRELKKLNDNIMKVYDKDANGDPASVIHGKLKGLFFSANVDVKTGGPRNPIFGDLRVMIPALKMLREDWHIYFADLYCLHEFHLVTLILTETGSEADKFCAQKLICLSRTDKSNNPFLFVSDGTVYVTSGVTVEVFYTKDIDLKLLESEYRGKRDEFSWWRNMRHGGKWKRNDCSTCNLYTSPLLDAFVC